MTTPILIEVCSTKFLPGSFLHHFLTLVFLLTLNSLQKQEDGELYVHQKNVMFLLWQTLSHFS